MSSDQSASRGMAEWIEGTGRRQRSSARAPPGRTGKGAVTLSKASLIGGGMSRVFEPITISRRGLLRGQNVHSIVIVVHFMFHLLLELSKS
jgi:hypothetical protein